MHFGRHMAYSPRSRWLKVQWQKRELGTRVSCNFPIYKELCRIKLCGQPVPAGIICDRIRVGPTGACSLGIELKRDPQLLVKKESDILVIGGGMFGA